MEAVIPVQLLMTVEEHEAGIITNQIDLGFLIAAELASLLDHAARRPSGNTPVLKAVPMRMNRLDVVTFVATE
jgi:hypothetical protein